MRATEEVKQKTDIVEVVSQYTALSKAGRLLKGLCPFHSEKHASFFVYPEQQSWHCFGACNTGGDVFSFIMKKEGLDFGEALRLLAERAGVSLPSRFEPGADKDERERLYQVNAAAAHYFHNLLLNSGGAQQAREYVTGRGLSEESVANFQLGYSLNSWQALTQYLTGQGYTEDELIKAGLIIKTDDGRTHDRFRSMLMFPICDARGHVAGFGGRVLDDSQPKYVNSPETSIFDKSSILYGLNLAAKGIRKQDRAIIVEGYTDVITAHQSGFKNVVASMGTSVTEKQISSLKRLSRNIILALDADSAGEEATLRGVSFENILNAEVRVIILPPGKDPDEVIKKDTASWQQLLDNAQPIIDYTFERVISGLDLTTAKDKSLAADRLLPTIAGIKDTIRQAHYLQKLSRLLKVSEGRLETALGEIKLDKDKGRFRVLKKPVAAPLKRSVLGSSLEEDCLALLLNHPELRAHSRELSPEYFVHSENREIFTAYQQSDDLSSLKAELAPALHQHLQDIVNKKAPLGVGQEFIDYVVKLSPVTPVEQRFARCIQRLREKFLKNLVIIKGEMLALEAEAGGKAAEISIQQEKGIEVSRELRELFIQRGKRHGGRGGSHGNS